MRQAGFLTSGASLWPPGAMLQSYGWGFQVGSPPPHPPQCVVIGLQSTGEARTREVLDERDGQLDCFVSAAE